MCKCDTCDKYNTECCIRIMESSSAQQIETLHQIQIESLQCNYNNLLKGIEKMITLMGSESFWKVNDTEQFNKNKEVNDV